MKYNPNRQCPKCGNELVYTKYDETTESMKRTCDKCGYYWHEESLDSEE